MRSLFFLIFFINYISIAHADINISEAWARASKPGQTIGAAYMTLMSKEENILVSVDTKAADTVEIHSMEMKNGIMKMRMLETLALPPNQKIKLTPGSFHLMLFDLKKPLKTGEKIDLTLCFKNKLGKMTHQNVSLPVQDYQR